MTVDTNDIGEKLNRLVKLALDTGEAASVAEATQLFKGYTLQVAVGYDAARSPAHQAALLTIVNTARRSLLGGVFVQGSLDGDLVVPFGTDRKTLGQAVVELGGQCGAAPDGSPLIALGNVDLNASGVFAVRVTFQGWRCGCIPLRDTARLGEQWGIATAGVAAGALAVSEAFQFLRGSAVAGRRRIGLSLWEPDTPWLAAADGAIADWLPASAWLIGLGNLGQAYLWTMGFLPYENPGDVRLVLQDFDTLAPSNDSTSVLTDMSMVNTRKTRAMAAWAENRGFHSDIVERRFGSDFRVQATEPQVALCGIDNALGRASLEQVGFGRIFEAGLGKGVSDFMGIRLHSFPAQRKAALIWDGVASPPQTEQLEQPAYRALAEAGVDKCGLTQLAGRSVGAPFVGCFAASLLISELMRLALGGVNYEVLDLHLKSPQHSTFVKQNADFAFNPGVVRARL